MNEIALETQFEELTDLIQKAREKVWKDVNSELVCLYWKIGEYISQKVNASEWGEKVVESLAEYLKKHLADSRGFNKRGLYRMKQFYETYKDHENVSALLTQISWTNHIIILSKSKSPEEREFYIRLSVKDNYSSRELERQINSGFFERQLLSDSNMSSPPTQIQHRLEGHFKDTYVLDFLTLPEPYSEKDLQSSIVTNLKKFLLEIGRDFTFIGQEYRIQVGNSDYYLDLLFFHRELSCLVAFELKITEFKPEYLGKMNFYLEALDRDVKKPHENPSVGVILCKSRDKEVVEYALSRNLSPTLVSEYKTKLIEKSVLKKRLHELFMISDNSEENDI
jgi:predicted nuclease of restriction endonuclease-like (RecB) superfamily